jgi:hypothetical protein
MASAFYPSDVWVNTVTVLSGDSIIMKPLTWDFMQPFVTLALPDSRIFSVSFYETFSVYIVS